MNLSKEISTFTAILLIIVISVVVGILVWQFKGVESPELELIELQVTTSEEESATKFPPNYTSSSACEEVGYYWYNQACHKRQQPEIADWEAYTSKEYGFGFQYPSKYTATSEYTTTNPHDPEKFQVTIQNPQYPEKLQAFAKKIPAKSYEWSDPIAGGRFWFDTEKNSWIRINHDDEEVSTQSLQFATTTHGAIVYKLATGDVGVFIQEYVVFNKSTNEVIVFRYSGSYNAFDVQGVPPEEIDSFERILEEVVKTSLFL